MFNSLKTWFNRIGCQPKWRNWGRNQSCSPSKIFYPKNLEDLKKIVQEANSQDINVHVYGSSHSWSDLVPTSGYLVNTDHLNRLLSVDPVKKQVRVEAGIKLHDLNRLLKEHHLALSNLGRVTVQSIAGVTATGTHGTGHTPTLSSFVTEVELLTADGTVRTISSEKNAHLLSAARLSLGALGIIYSLTIQCEECFVLEDHCYISKFNEIINNYEKLLNTHDYWMFEWNPYTGKALSYAWDRTNSTSTHSIFKIVLGSIHEAIFDALTLLSRPFSMLQPKVIDLRFHFTAHAPRCADSDHVLTRPYLGMRYVECEMSIKPILLSNAVEELKKLFKEHQAQGIYVPRVTFRFVAHEKGTLLSPTYDGDRVFISLVMPANSAFHIVFPDYQSRMAAFEARPHWGKIHKMDAKLAQQLYGENLKQFLKIRKDLDPKGLFINAQIQQSMTNQ